MQATVVFNRHKDGDWFFEFSKDGVSTPSAADTAPEYICTDGWRPAWLYLTDAGYIFDKFVLESDKQKT